jgi:protein-glucosylgalactosylhydroxylysine glucosidase
MVSRRKFLGTLISSAGLSHWAYGRELMEGKARGESAVQAHSRKIDRAILVTRHNPRLAKLDPLSPLTLGNGEFAFTSDVTGLQTLPQEYEQAMPLCTMSQWGWHSAPAPAGLDTKALRLTQYDTHGRSVGYQTSSEGQTELYTWLRENPHRLHLGQIGLYRTGQPKEIQIGDLSDIEQQLDLWRGVLTSSFKFAGERVTVTTAVHPQLDLLAVSIESRLIDQGRLSVGFRFPYGSPSMQAADWNQPTHHQTEVISNNNGRASLRRTLDQDKYFAAIAWEGPSELIAVDKHWFSLSRQRGSGGHLEFVVAFAPQPLASSLPGVKATIDASAEHWQRFWIDGGAVELADSKNQQAVELERRVVLSQYLTAIQCAGSKPPQETGLTVNSWYGKFHLEMHWWHAAHFALWNRLPLLQRSLGWYESILPAAKALAKSQGYEGARWPKMVGPDGRDSPSPIGPLLIWQQPHPIFYAELCYQSVPGRRTLDRYREIVFDSAAFMAAYAFWEEQRNRYVLGPPLIPAQENHPPRETWNPTFELAYWRYGLTTAQRWRERLGLKRNPTWDRVIKGLASLPVSEGVYLAHENCPQTYSERNYDHPSMLGAFGVLPGDGVEPETMRRTLSKTMKEWRWEDTWGWDYPLTAMTAARLGESEIAIDALLMRTEKNRYLPNGHNWQRQNLPCYLPGNGGLLYAIALMAAGWRDAPRRPAPGFPQDGWVVRWENLNSSLTRKI